MRTIGTPLVRYALLAALAIPSYALAQVTEEPDADEESTPSASDPKPEGQLPAVRSDDDPVPPPAAPVDPDATIVKQAGIGGPVAYGRAGVLELGGAASFSTASDYTQLSIRPSIGWFVANNLELSAILAINYLNVEDDSGGDVSATTWSALLEPSYHLPLGPTMWAFLGIGAGISHVNDETGFALAPRLGMNFLVGRSGILTPALLVQYSTTDAVETGDGQTLVGVSTTFGLSVGYTVMW
jgi:hypothetical protein